MVSRQHTLQYAKLCSTKSSSRNGRLYLCAMKIEATSRPVAIWLLTGVAMVVIQIALGGITRLTGSGLSITEWNVVTGALPPLTAADWAVEFAKYQQTPQFRLLNFDFTLQEFKYIFFWEWFHRFWARLIGIVFIIPFIYFLWTRQFKSTMIRPLLILFLLGALQGAVGWIMVASGLTGDAIYVKPTRLALHFVLALGLLSYTFWFALQLLVPGDQRVAIPAIRKSVIFILSLLVLQLAYGAFMAGHKAATAAPSWPDINGQIVPDLLSNASGILFWVENKIAIHFVHRGLAYILLIAVVLLTFRLHRPHGSRLLQKASWFPITLVLLQVLLGILSVLYSTSIIPGQWGIFEWMAQLHQLVAMLLLLSLVMLLYLTRERV
jgi:cytochrome c oxidase assembly protein subunit 15